MSKTGTASKGAGATAAFTGLTIFGITEAIGIPLTIIFAALKASEWKDTAIVDWSWFQVFLPILTGIGGGAAFLIIGLILVLFGVVHDE